MPTSLNLLEKIREDISLLQELERFAANPRALDLMRSYVANGEAGTLSSGVAAPSKPPTPNKLRTVGKPSAFSGLPTGLTEATWKAVESFGPKDFTALEVVNRMGEHGYKFQNANPRIATSTTIQKFAKKEKVQIIKRGIGSEPSVYRLSPAQEEFEILT